MNDAIGPAGETKGTLVANLMHFARALRVAGLPIGPGRVLDAVRAVQAAGIASRDDFYWSLFAVFVNRRDQREIFDQAFRLFWRDPRILERMMSLLLPQSGAAAEEQKAAAAARRAQEAMAAGAERDRPKPQESEEHTLDAAMTASERELLQKKDFEQMSSEELRQAKLAMARLHLPHWEVPTRRFRPSASGARTDMRATLRATLRAGGDVIALKFRQRRMLPPPLVVLCDISGSMERYSRMFVHFLHALSNDRDRVSVFLFGTRLTNVTRQLRHRDVDVALAKVAEAVEDWSGGTRIGVSLAEFNLRWARRVLGQNAVVLLITDGLDRDGGAGLGREMERLAKSSRRVIWLNPLLRYAKFEPKSLGMKAILPHVDDFRPAHNLESLTALVEALSTDLGHGARAPYMVKERAA